MPAPWPTEFAEWKNAVEKALQQNGTDITRLWKRVHQTPQEYTGAPHGWVDNPGANPPVVELPPVVTTTPGEATTTGGGTTGDGGTTTTTTTTGEGTTTTTPEATTTTTPEATTTPEVTTTGDGGGTTGGGGEGTTTGEATTTTTSDGGPTTTTTTGETTTTTTPEATTTPEVTTTPEETTTAEATTTAGGGTTAEPTTTAGGIDTCGCTDVSETLYLRQSSGDALVATLNYNVGIWFGSGSTGANPVNDYTFECIVDGTADWQLTEGATPFANTLGSVGCSGTLAEFTGTAEGNLYVSDS